MREIQAMQQAKNASDDFLLSTLHGATVGRNGGRESNAAVGVDRSALTDLAEMHHRKENSRGILASDNVSQQWGTFVDRKQYEAIMEIDDWA